MDIKTVKEKLLAKLPEGSVTENAPMAKETTFRCGGNADLLVTVSDLDGLKFTLSVMKAFGMPWMILGNGSNVLFKDSGYRGAVIKLSGEFSEVVLEGTEMTAGPGVLLAYLSKLAAANSLSGLEFACGIPGSLGGGIFMNAGAYGGTMADVVKSVTAVTPEGEIYEYGEDELELSYRHSRFMDSGEVIVRAKLLLKEGNREEIQALMDEKNRARREKQPVSYPSAGSFFKRPEGYYAAALIDQTGLKGLSVGGAEVSELHAGFIINKGGATATDVLALMEKVQSAVFEKYGVRLEPEVRIIGE